jgi:DNA-binding NarL/FixJ family response regulator
MGGRATLMGGSMKTDRDVMELARDKLSVEQIATKLKITPKTVNQLAIRHLPSAVA